MAVSSPSAAAVAWAEQYTEATVRSPCTSEPAPTLQAIPASARLAFRLAFRSASALASVGRATAASLYARVGAFFQVIQGGLRLTRGATGLAGARRDQGPSGGGTGAVDGEGGGPQSGRHQARADDRAEERGDRTERTGVTAVIPA
eukprot:5914070-Pyramimonas_sp.AAC.3